MNMQRFWKAMTQFWERFNHGWAHAAEMQRRIEEGRSAHARIYIYWRM